MEFRRGQWVNANLKEGVAVGIFMPERRGGRIVNTVHLVAADGTTSQVLDADGLDLSAVTDLNDLPESRRAHLPEGYNPAVQRVPDPPAAAKGKK